MMTKADARSSLISLLRGVEHFNSEVFPEKKELFSRLAEGQSPHTLLIACADSRVTPDLITQQDPGNLFIVRNVGNIVPAYGEALGGVSSAIEYGVMALKVSHIIICGHSNCGAMTALCSPDPSKLDAMPTVRTWLKNAEAARAVAGALNSEDGGPPSVQSMSEQNVLLQIAHLRTHPSVAAALAREELIIQGWFYDIGTGEVLVLDEKTRKSISINEAIRQLDAGVPTT
ncbi:carbonic anhydrase [Acetobacter sp. AN02]|uniref:carbonic anhydrase n=1 Tax=Acetobacter sp. AN02 TaxID=2894186 RepID=UPI00243464B5|nr:carbonic anhydrase [Acetobacter sp. AN02]MDG6093793.1 carbonic anhydrase [Acetobacter sp. AN02]